MTDIYVQRARIAALSRHHPDDSPVMLEARAKLGEDMLIRSVEQALAKAPPLTPEMRQRIVSLLAVA